MFDKQVRTIMGIRERRDRERHELRQGILAAARDIALQDGWQAVTIRKVAERVEYSPPMIYEHFASKDAILTELMREGHTRLRNALREAREAAPGARAAVRTMALAYYRFAREYPELYQVMYGLGGVPFCTDVTPAEIEEVYKEAYTALETLKTQTNARIENVDDAVEILWASLHGLVTLSMTERIEGGMQRIEQLALAMVNNLFVAWQAIGD